MDKNMINIDDLFRQRLSGGEEKERPGAWLQMRELLDKEMPVVAGNTTNWRRIFGYAAGLVLLASASIGGYTAYTSFKDAEKELPAPIAAVTTAKPGGSNNSGSTMMATKQLSEVDEATSNETTGAAQQLNKAATATMSGKSVSQHTAGRGLATASNATNLNISGKANPSSGNNVSNNVAATTPETSNKMVQGNEGKPAVVKQGTVTNKANANQQAAVTSTIASNNNKATSQVTGNSSASTVNKATKVTAASNSNAPAQEKMFASAGSTTNDNKKPVASQLQNNPSASTSTSGSNASKNEVAKNDNTKKNLIDKVEERETYDRRTGAWKKDTIDKGKVEWKQQEDPLVAKVDKPADNTAAPIVPASAATVKAENNDAEKLVSLSDFRTSSKNSNYATSNFFEEMVKNAKLQLGGVRFYPGLIVGINTALSGKNSMTGFQVGVTGNLSLNEKWGIVSELKYMQRFKNGTKESNRNDYVDHAQSVNNGQYYTWDSVVSYFNYPTVSSVELPVMIKYSFNRFNVLAGANLAYYMGFTPDHKEFIYKREGTTVPPPSSGAIMTSKDFGSRFGVGYLFGVGYQVSPAIQLDMRMTQSVWDNAASAGSERVSKEVFQLPSLQFNMSYRFSSNKYKPYRSQQ